MERFDSSSSNNDSRARPISIIVAFIGIILSITFGLFIANVANAKQVFLVVFALATFIVTFARLEWGVIAMIIVLYTQTYIIVGERYGITNVVQGLISLLVLVMVTRWIVYSNEIPQGWLRSVFAVSFYCIVCLASVFYAEDVWAAMPVAIETLKSGAIALIISVVLSNEKSFRLAIWSLLVVGIFLGLLSTYQYFTGTYDNDYGGYALAFVQNISGETNDYRLGGPVGDPNFYAQMMLVLVPLALDRLWNEKQKMLRLVAGVALGICSFTVLLTYSRGGFLAMMLVLALMMFMSKRGNLRYLLAVGVVALLLINFLPSEFTVRLRTLTELFPSSDTNGPVRDYSFRGRTSEMIVALQMFADHPILGVGLGNYPVLYQQYSQRLGIEVRSGARQAHSLYLEVASETGLLGLFSFSLLLWMIFRSIARASRLLVQRGLTSLSNMIMAYGLGFSGYLIAALFIHSAYPRNFWVLAGIALCIPRVAEVELEATELSNYSRLRSSTSTAAPQH